MARAEQDWIADARVHLLRSDLRAAGAILDAALVEYPASMGLGLLAAGLLEKAGRPDAAAARFGELRERDPTDPAPAFALAELLTRGFRPAAAARVLLGHLARVDVIPSDLAIQAVELLDDGDRKADALAIAQAAIDTHPDDARLHAYAGMLAIQLGQFERARRHYVHALVHDTRAWEWHAALGLSATHRYDDLADPDFALFRRGLDRDDLSQLAMAELHFALGKGYDDLDDFAHAAQHFAEGNRLRRSLAHWSLKAWRRTIQARVAAPQPPTNTSPAADFVPIFIVGMPRTGTTVLADRLARCHGVCNRGEQAALAGVAARFELAGKPTGAIVATAAESYRRQTQRDDSGDARWFIDKQPLNFRYIGLALAMFPNARVLYCERDPRDTALSLWMRCSLEPVQDYSYALKDMMPVMRDCARLMAHWRSHYPDAIRSVQYEELVRAPATTLADLADWIGLSPPDAANAAPAVAAISTASLWQARQPITTRRVGRWRCYVPFVPELDRVPAG